MKVEQQMFTKRADWPILRSMGSRARQDEGITLSCNVDAANYIRPCANTDSSKTRQSSPAVSVFSAQNGHMIRGSRIREIAPETIGINPRTLISHGMSKENIFLGIYKTTALMVAVR